MVCWFKGGFDMMMAVQNQCELFVQNKERVKKDMWIEDGGIQLACAGICTSNNKVYDKEVFDFCKKILNNKVGTFSKFRGTFQSVIVTLMMMYEDPEKYLEKGLCAYNVLKEYYKESVHLTFVAMSMAQYVDEKDYEMIVERSQRIYKQLKDRHPFLTGNKDIVYCVLMAMSEKPNDAFLEEVEEIYTILKQKFSIGWTTQALSLVLALIEGTVEEKTQYIFEIYSQLKEAGCKYGTGNELPMLGLWLVKNPDCSKSVHSMVEVDQWLREQKGFGVWGTITNTQRRRYASMLVNNQIGNESRADDGNAIQMAIATNTIIDTTVTQNVSLFSIIIAGVISVFIPL